MNTSKDREAIKVAAWVLALVAIGCALMAWAGQPAKTKTLEFSGTAPVGAYTYPSNFAQGRSPGSGMTMLGVEITRDQLTNPATVVELVVEVSFDGGASWPPSCLSTVNCLCHDASQDKLMPGDTQWCAFTLRGGATALTSPLECSWSRISDSNTRLRGRLNVCGASATGSIYTTWR